MKKILVIICLSLFSNIYTQEIGSTYKFIVPVNDEENLIQFKKGHNVFVTKVLNDTVFFSYYKFSPGENSTELNNRYYYETNEIFIEMNNPNNGDQDDNNIKTFSLSKDDFEKYLARLYPRFKGVSAGIFTVPFKLRIDDFDFEQNVNIGMNLSFPFRMNRLKENEHLLTPTIGIGLATTSLNPNNSDLQASDNENENRTASAFSFSGGLMYQFSSTINIGLQYGFDFLGNSDKGIRWKYDRKPWLGIGINIGVSVSNNENSEAKN